MAETDDVLQKSLDAVDRHKRRVLWATAITTALLMVAFYQTHAGRLGDTRTMIAGSVMILGFWTSGLALVIVVQITVATKRILRAIDLASKR